MRQLLFMLLLLAAFNVKAQTFDNPVEYMSYIGKQNENVSKKFLSYTSAASHGRGARKVEKLRQQLLNEIQESRANISSMGKYKGDGAYKDSSANFMKFYLNVLNEDYARIVNMEEIAERSYDEMEAYLLLEEQVDIKIKEANERINTAEKAFASKYNVQLVESENKLGIMMKKVGEVNKYYREVYLIFFKPYLQESNMLKAVEKSNVNGIEQDKNALGKYAQEGITLLQALKPYEGGQALRAACKNLLQFYLQEANEKMKATTDFFLVKDRFEAMQKNFNKKASPSKEDVDAYNKGVKEMNDASNAYNSNNKILFEQRKMLLDNWNKSVEEFYDSEMPKYK